MPGTSSYLCPGRSGYQRVPCTLQEKKSPRGYACLGDDQPTLLDLCSKGVMKSGSEPKDVARIATWRHGPAGDLTELSRSRGSNWHVVESAKEDRR